MSQEHESNRGFMKRLFGRVVNNSEGCCGQQVFPKKKAPKKGGCCNIEIIDLDQEERNSKQPK